MIVMLVLAVLMMLEVVVGEAVVGWGSGCCVYGVRFGFGRSGLVTSVRSVCSEFVFGSGIGGM